MWKRKYTQMPAAAIPWPTIPASPARPTHTDDTRRHAVNWLLGVTAIGAVAIAAIWRILASFNVCDHNALWAFLPLAPAVGLVASGWQLIKYTQEYRNFLYTLAANEAEDDADAQKRKPGDPLPGTMIRGIDGAMHRIDVELTAEELRAIKKQLLADNAYNVRALTPLLADRASALRKELHALGIITKPQSRSAAKLTEAGRKAVMRWQ